MIPVERILPILDRAEEMHSPEALAARGINQRQIYRIRNESRDVSLRVADLIVTAVDPTLWHTELSDLLPASRAHQVGGPQLDRRAKLPAALLGELHMLHTQGGLTLYEIGRLVWRKYGYASPESAASALKQRFLTHGLLVYPRERGSCRRRPSRKLTEAQIRATQTLYETGMSFDQIGKLIWEKYGYPSARGASRSVYRYFVSRGFPRRNRREQNRKLKAKHIQLAIARYERGESITEIAADLWRDCGYTNAHSCATCLYKSLRALGVPLRDRGEALRLKWQRTPHPLRGIDPRTFWRDAA
jgi:hypothetical protein